MKIPCQNTMGGIMVPILPMESAPLDLELRDILDKIHEVRTFYYANGSEMDGAIRERLVQVRETLEEMITDLRGEG